MPAAEDVQVLAQRARRAYELGRLRAAGRLLWVLVPLVVAAGLIERRWTLCAGIGAALVIGTVLCRWRSREMGDAATHGFLVGAFAAVIGLGIKALMAQQGEHALASAAGVACALSGVIGGYVLFRLSEKLEVNCTGKYWSVAIAAAGTTAPLGCIDLSRLQLSLLGTGLLVTATVGFLVRRYRHSPVVG
jgi:hypothetical protein